MTAYFAPTALLPDGWADAVRIEVDALGQITAVTPKAESRNASLLSGPVLPGMPNLHSHAFQRAMAGWAERAGSGDFWAWRDTMYRFLAKLGPDEMEAVATQLYIEMLKAGYTAVGEFHYVHHAQDGSPYDAPTEMSNRVIAAAAKAGIGLTLLPVLYAQGGFDGVPTGDGQRRFANDPDTLLSIASILRRAHTDDPQLRIGIAPHSLRAVSPEALAAVVAGVQAEDEMAPIHIHVAEQTREVEDCQTWSGMRPVEWLLSEAPVDGRWCLVHATHMTPEETRALAASDAVAGLCPTTEANLGDGLFALPDYLKSGGKLGIGSDSNVSVNPVEELRWLEYGQRLARRDRIVAASDSAPSTGARLLNATLAGGAQALGRPIGRIETGHRADLVVLDAEHPALIERSGDGLLDSLVFASGGSPISDVVVGGRRVIRDGRHAAEDAALDAFRHALRTLSG